jgi:FG-GAP-like repeat
MEELFGVTAPGGGFLGDANSPTTKDLSDLFLPQPPAESLIGQTGAQWWLSATNNGSNGFLPPSGAVNFGSAAANTAAAQWVDVQVGDFDGNSSGELAGRVAQTGQWWVAVPNGAGGFTTTVWANWAPLSWQHVLAGDFNGDGKTDLAAMEPDNGTWWVAVSTGTGFTTSAWANWAPLNWLHVVAGDFNGDGKTDIAAMEPDNGEWWVAAANPTGNGFATSAWGGWTPDHAGSLPRCKAWRSTGGQNEPQLFLRRTYIDSESPFTLLVPPGDLDQPAAHPAGAHLLEWSAPFGPLTLTARQLIVLYGPRAFVVSATAPTATFNAHRRDFQAILDAFQLPNPQGR